MFVLTLLPFWQKILNFKATHRTRDNLVYAYRLGEFTFWELSQDPPDTAPTTFRAKKVTLKEVPVDSVRLRWKEVGVFLHDGLEANEVYLNEKDITGKAIFVKNYILSIPPDSLFEAT